MTKLFSEKLRPTTFDEITLPLQLKSRLVNMYNTGNVMNMLFYGKPGSGKTTAAKIFTNSEKFDSITINGSIDNGIDEIRNKISNFASSCSLIDNKKICFIDESDYLSKNAQEALRGVIESTSSNCRFIFTANDLKKMHSALCSRLIPISFDMTMTQTLVQLESYTKRLIETLKSDEITFDEERVKRVVQLHFPDYRLISNSIEFEFYN